MFGRLLLCLFLCLALQSEALGEDAEAGLLEARFDKICVEDLGYYDNPETCLQVATQLVASPLVSDDFELGARAELYIGLSHYMLSGYETALETLKRVEPSLSGLDRERAASHIYQIYRLKGELAQALKKMNENLEITAREGDWPGHALTTLDMIHLKLSIGDKEKAGHYSQIAERLYEGPELQKEPAYPYALQFFGTVDLENGRYQEALEHFAVSEAEMQKRGYDDLAGLQTERGRAYVALGQNDRALRDFTAAIKNAETAHDDIQAIKAGSERSALLYEMGRLQAAYDQSMQTFEIISQMEGDEWDNAPFISQHNVFATMGNILRDMGNQAESSDYFQRAYESAKETLRENNRQAVAVAEVQAGTQIERQRLALLSQKAEIDQFQIRSQRLSLVVAGIGLALLSVLAFALHRGNEAKRSSLALKETYLAETHHRIKNNLQLVTSLLSIEARKRSKAAKPDSEASTLAFKDTAARVRSMGALHEHLYMQDDASKVALKEYITDLTSDLLDAYGPDAVELDLQIEPVSTNADIAIPVGLIVCELFINAMKYAFDSQDNAKIFVLLEKTKRDECRLEISDNGNGLYDQNSDTHGTGSQLVSDLADQLGTTLSVDAQPGVGTRWVMFIPH